MTTPPSIDFHPGDSMATVQRKRAIGQLLKFAGRLRDTADRIDREAHRLAEDDRKSATTVVGDALHEVMTMLANVQVGLLVDVAGDADSARAEEKAAREALEVRS